MALRANPPPRYLQSEVGSYPERDGRILTMLLNVEVSGRSSGCLGGSFGASGGPGSIRGLREGLQGVLGLFGARPWDHPNHYAWAIFYEMKGLSGSHFFQTVFITVHTAEQGG